MSETDEELVLFMDGSTTTPHNAAHRGATAFHLAPGTSPVKKGTPSSRQLAELVAVHLVLRDTIKWGLLQIHITKGFWAVSNGVMGLVWPMAKGQFSHTSPTGVPRYKRN